MSLNIQLDYAFDALDVRLEALAICEIDKHYSLECEPHNEVLIHFVLRGEGELECKHGNFPLLKGSATIVPPLTAKSLKGAGPTLHVRRAEGACNPKDGIFRYDAGENRDGLLLGCAVLTSPGGSPFAKLRAPFTAKTDDASLQSLFAAMLAELRQPREGTRAFLSAIMKQILIMMFRSDGQDRRLEGSNISGLGLKRALDRILQDPLAPHSLQSLANEAAMSRTRFSAQFVEEFGASPMAFVASIRLASAAQLLMNSQMPVKAIAAAVGYGSRSQFSSAFHKKYGVSAADFRKTARLRAA